MKTMLIGGLLILGLFIYGCQPDLEVEYTISDEDTLSGGVVFPVVLEVTVRNSGNENARGTDSGSDESYMVDLVLSSDDRVPLRFAVVPDPYVFEEDMLIRGGRISNTKSLEPGESKTYVLTYTRTDTMKVVPDSLPRTVYLFAIVDPGKKVEESEENNNTFGKKVYPPQ